MDFLLKKINVYLLLSFFRSMWMGEKEPLVHYIARHTIENVSNSYS